ncbi:MAG: hypothetical protein ACHQVS_02325 [Candidatus Babeliales bacterium]
MIKKLTFSLLLNLFIIVPIHALSLEDTTKIGMRIWHNEASQKRDLLVFWSQYEPFPSLGIGHCIWYPQGVEPRYTQVFPELCIYLQEHGVILPSWLEEAKDTGAPWKSREEFLQDKERTEELRTLLEATIPLQTQFMIDRLEQQWPYILQAAPLEKQEQLDYYYTLMKSSPLGTYAVVDYLNFKGNGLNPLEESNGQRWGLLQVMLDMPTGLTQENMTKAFTLSAAKILIILVQNSAPDYRRFRYLHGWIRRISSYADESLFSN